MFPGRKFTPDGHLIGSIGEVIAAHMYGLTLLSNSTEGHDAVSGSGRLVEIKATQVRSVALRSKPTHLIVLKLSNDGQAEEVYNGPGDLAWENAGTMQKNGQKSIGLSKLKGLMENVSSAQRINQISQK